MAKKKINKREEDLKQKKFSGEVDIPEGQVRERHLKQEDKELVLNTIEPLDVKDTNKRVIESDLDLDKRYENIEFGDAINQQRVSNKRRIRRTIDEKVDVVEVHIYDTDDNLLTSTHAKKGEEWYFLNENEKSFKKDSSGTFTGEQSKYDRVILEPHKILRRLDFKRGTYRVNFNFHRNRLGSDHTFFIDTEEVKNNNRGPHLIKRKDTLTLDNGKVVIKSKDGRASNRYLKKYQKKLFIQEISPSRTEVRALIVNPFADVIGRKFKKEFTGGIDNFELFDKKTQSVTQVESKVFLTVDTYPEKPRGEKKAKVGTALVTISRRPGRRRRKRRHEFKFTPDMVGGVLTIPRKGLQGINTFDLYSDFEAEIVEYIDESTLRVGSEFRQPTPIGDVNLDDRVNALDFDKLFNYIQGNERLTGLAQYQADLDQDGRIDLADALWTLRVAIQEVKKLGYNRVGNDVVGKGALSADRIFGTANDILAQYKMTAQQRTIFDINRDGRIDNIDLLRFLENDVIDVVTEITEVMRRPFKIEYENPYWDERKSLRYLMNFGDNERHLLTNWATDSVTYPEYPHSLVFKLYEPLPKSIKQKSYFHIVEEITPSVIEDVVLTGEVEKQAQWKLRPPNWDNIDPKFKGKAEPVELSSWNDLLTTDNVTSQQLVDKYFEGTYDGTDLNIDYNSYSNFVHFGSGAERLANFKYKMQLLESYSGSIAEESKISGSTTSITSYESKKTELINSFDGYEKHMYFESGSTYSDSFGFHPDTTWPKTGTGTKVNEPFKLAKVDSEEGMNWYEKQFASASAYDKTNRDSLLNTLPIHMKENESNEQFFLFLDMIGQHFDTIWTYINHLTNVTQRKEQKTEGMPQDIIYHVVQSMGHQLDLGSNVLELWEYALGSDESGSFKYEGRESYEDTSKEVWRRIANNLPYILKHKGTARSIKALMSCYGVPETILKIREYGGPNIVESTVESELNDYRKSAFTEDNGFVYAAKFKSDSYIKGSWDNSTPSGRYPDTVEFRFRTDNASWAKPHKQQTIFQVAENWGILTEQSASSEKRGRVIFSISASDGSGYKKITTPYVDLFDNSWYNVMVRRNTLDDTPSDQTYELFVKKFDDELGRISFNASSSLETSDQVFNDSWTGSRNDFYLGSTGSTGFGTPFVGNIMEYRQWGSSLKELAFENHTQAPQTYNGNTFYSSYDNIITRHKLDTTQDYSSATSVTDHKPNQTDVSPNRKNPSTAVGFGSSDYDEVYITNRMVSPNMGPNRRVDNKVRLEDGGLYYGNLSVNKRAEKSANDTAPLDSPKVGVYLSPQEILNDDIMRTFADIDFDSLIGDPRDQYRDNYPDLNLARYLYFRKYEKDPINLSDYIDIVKLYDLSLFDQIKKLLPARVKPSSGVLIEPHILERPKVKWNKPTIDNRYHEGGMSPAPSQSGEFILEEGEAPRPIIVDGEEVSFDGTMDKPVIPGGEEVSFDGTMDKPVITEGEETTYEGEMDKPVILEGNEETHEGEVSEMVTEVEGNYPTYDGEIDDSVIDVEGNNPSYDGTVEGETITAEGETKNLEDNIELEQNELEGETIPLDDTIEKPVNELEGETTPLDDTIEKPVNELEGDSSNIEAIWHNPHKFVSSKYNEKVYILETSSLAPNGNLQWEGFQDVPKTVWTIEGAELPSHFPDVKGNPIREVGFMTEALLPIYNEPYVPTENAYTKEDILLESSFNKGKYASSMKQRRGVGFEYPGSIPQYFVSSSIDDKIRGWYSGSSNIGTVTNFIELPYFILDNNSEEDSDLLYAEKDDGTVEYLIDGPSGSDLVPSDTNLLQRDGRPGVFEIREFDRPDRESLVHNTIEKVQGLYVENVSDTNSINLSSSFWNWPDYDAPNDINWEVGGSTGGRGYYARFGTRGKFEFKQWDEYQLEFSLKKLTENPNSLVTVHLLRDLNDSIDLEGDKKAPWGSTLLGKCYQTTTFRKRFTAQQSGHFCIVFVIHGGTDENNVAHNTFKFYITDFKLSHMKPADYNSSTNYSTAMKNLYYRGCKQTDNTTPDGLPAVEWTDSNPNVLVVDPSGETELDVF